MQLGVSKAKAQKFQGRAGQAHSDLGNQGRLLGGRVNKAETRMMSESVSPRSEREADGVGSPRGPGLVQPRTESLGCLVHRCKLGSGQ